MLTTIQCALDVAKLTGILQLDRITIIAQIQVILKDKETYRTFVSQSSVEAEHLLSLLQEVWPVFLSIWIELIMCLS